MSEHSEAVSGGPLTVIIVGLFGLATVLLNAWLGKSDPEARMRRSLISDVRDELAREKADAYLWQRRARRDNRYAIDTANALRNERKKNGDTTPVPDPPILEEPFDK